MVLFLKIEKLALLKLLVRIWVCSRIHKALIEYVLKIETIVKTLICYPFSSVSLTTRLDNCCQIGIKSKLLITILFKSPYVIE